MTDTLGEDEVHLWHAEPDTVVVPSEEERYRFLLDADEAARYRGLRFAHHQRQYLAAHALLRTALSRYASVRPEDWVFARNAFGRPEIAGPRRAPPLRFNLSHTDGLVACGVARVADIGVDVESISRRLPSLELAKRYFTLTEYRSLCNRPPSAQAQTFLTHWTLKEAYIKARGKGLSLPLDSIALDRKESGDWAVRFAEGADAEPDDWQFALKRVKSRHLMAIAARRPKGAVLSFKIRPAAWLLRSGRDLG